MSVTLHGGELQQAGHEVLGEIGHLVGPAKVVLAGTYSLEELGTVAPLEG